MPLMWLPNWHPLEYCPWNKLPLAFFMPNFQSLDIENFNETCKYTIPQPNEINSPSK